MVIPTEGEEMTEIRELLPIGSVVLLENAEKSLMIFGVKQRNLDTGEEYDYIGVLYPEGNMGKDTQFLFNHENIQEVLFEGYHTDERTQFLGRLAEFYEHNK